MGTIQHHAVIATGGDDQHRDQVTAWIASRGENHQRRYLVGPMVINGYFTVVLTPDGSKEGWDDSDAGDAERDEFVAWLSEPDTYWDWVEVTYGEIGYRITRSDDD